MHVHYIEAVAKFVGEKELKSAHTSVLLVLWACVRNPFADTPTVYASRSYIAARTGCAEVYIKQLLGELQSAGILRKGASVKGRGTAITLLRPDFGPDDNIVNPFEPSTEEDAAARTVEMLRADGQIAKPKAKAKAKREPLAKPAVKLSDIALAIEDAAGYTRKDNGKPHNRYSSGRVSKPWIAAAQRFISEHGQDAFEHVCRMYRPHVDGKPARERIYLFEDTTLTDTLRAAKPPTVTAEQLTNGLVKAGADEAEAREVVGKHWGRLSTMAPSEIRDLFNPWKVANPRPSLASLFQDHA